LECLWRLILNRRWKSHWVSITEPPLFTKLLYANTRCSNVHCSMMATEMAWPGEFNAPLPKSLPPLPALYHQSENRLFPITHPVEFKYTSKTSNELGLSIFFTCGLHKVVLSSDGNVQAKIWGGK
jgi:hypothetical protein